LSNREKLVDCIYIAASALDSRYTRICLASIRYFYAEVPIRLLVGGRLQRGLANELQQYWGVRLANVPAGDYGWGFVKLEVLFGPPGERFLVLDSDTALTGSILDEWTDRDAPVLVDDEEQSEADTKRLYYDWKKVRGIDRNAQRPRFVFNSGQWFGTAGVITRDDFAPWLEWTMPRSLRYPKLFMPGDQGILNYVLNQKAALDGLRVERQKIMRWPGHSMDGLDFKSVANGTAPPLVIHWAGIKETFLHNMVGGDVLQFFEDFYYRKLPAGRLRRVLALWRHVWSQWTFALSRRVKLRFRIWFGSPSSEKASPVLVKQAIGS
jgi:hypothetical protein